MEEKCTNHLSNAVGHLVSSAILGKQKTMSKMAIGAASLLLIPLLFLTMLPGVIFNGFSEAYSPVDPLSPILNSETALVETAREISESIREVLREALAVTIADIGTSFQASGADNYEIDNPYESDLSFSANQFVSMYCAAKGDQINKISIDDMIAMLRANLDHLYSYSCETVSREVIVTVPVPEETSPPDDDLPMLERKLETGDLPSEPAPTEEIVVIETWQIYTISYNGERYFADHVFHLTEEQKKLSDDYAYNLSLFLNDGMYQQLGNWTGHSIPSLGNIRFTDGSTEVVYYNQLDERYANKPFGTDHIGGYGCGPTAMAMVVSSMTDDMVDPIEMARWAYENGYWCSRSGSYHTLIPGAAKNWGLAVSGCTASEPQRIVDALSDGKLVVALMYEGHFTNSGHFIVLRGIRNGKILVADPASYSRSEAEWDLEIILTEAGHNAGAGGPFWIIG